jgi:8-oxo-dGTP pyrophosphatase MutT (NUDIX family)
VTEATRIEATRIVEVVELDFDYDPTPWSFAEAQADRIANYWAALCARKPALFNGRVLLLARRALARRADGGLRLGGAYFETDYANYVAWRDWGHPGERVENCFSMAALRAADGAYLLGEMASHTLNAGRIYFPAGTPDPNDILGAKVDLEGSARRELLEETGLQAEETAISKDWTIVFEASRVACMKPMTLAVPADEAKARIEAFLRGDPHAELSRIHIVRRTEDIDEARTPPFVAAYLRAAFAA